MKITNENKGYENKGHGNEYPKEWFTHQVGLGFPFHNTKWQSKHQYMGLRFQFSLTGKPNTPLKLYWLVIYCYSSEYRLIKFIWFLSFSGGIFNNTLRPAIPSYCDPEWKKLMEQCWDSDPTVRPTFTEIANRLRVMHEACQAGTHVHKASK